MRWMSMIACLLLVAVFRALFCDTMAVSAGGTMVWNTCAEHDSSAVEELSST